jgi:hypothetical protein
MATLLQPKQPSRAFTSMVEWKAQAILRIHNLTGDAKIPRPPKAQVTTFNRALIEALVR